MANEISRLNVAGFVNFLGYKELFVSCIKAVSWRFYLCISLVRSGFVQ